MWSWWSKNYIKAIWPNFAVDRIFVSTFQILNVIFLVFVNVFILSLAHQPESMSNGLQGLNCHILKNKQTNKILPQLCFVFSEIGKPLKITWASITNWTCQNNSSGLYAVPCSHISWGMLKTRCISTSINSSGILLLHLSFMSKEPPYHMTGLGIKINNWSAWMNPLTWEERTLEDASVLLRGYALTSTRTSQAHDKAISCRYPHAQGGSDRHRSSRAYWKKLWLIPLQRVGGHLY